MPWKSKRATRPIVVAIAGVLAAPFTALSAPGDPIDPATWVRGPLYAAPANVPIWNPVKQKRLANQEFFIATVSTFTLSGYCSTAALGDATWTEMQHSPTDWTQVWAMWAQPCAYVPNVGPVPGSRLSTLLKRDIQKAVDGGAMVVIVPTVDSVAEAKDIIDLIYYPPIGHRKYGPSQAEKMYANVPGGYRETFNANLVLVFMNETILAAQAANDIAALPNFDGLFGATSDLGNFSDFASPNVDYEKLIKNAYDAAKSHGKAACSSTAFRGRSYNAGPYNLTYSFDCYQGNRPGS